MGAPTLPVARLDLQAHERLALVDLLQRTANALSNPTAVLTWPQIQVLVAAAHQAGLQSLETLLLAALERRDLDSHR